MLLGCGNRQTTRSHLRAACGLSCTSPERGSGHFVSRLGRERAHAHHAVAPQQHVCEAARTPHARGAADAAARTRGPCVHLAQLDKLLANVAQDEVEVRIVELEPAFHPPSDPVFAAHNHADAPLAELAQHAARAVVAAPAPHVGQLGWPARFLGFGRCARCCGTLPIRCFRRQRVLAARAKVAQVARKDCRRRALREQPPALVDVIERSHVWAGYWHVIRSECETGVEFW